MWIRGRWGKSRALSYKRNRDGPFLRVLSRTEVLRRLTRCALNNSALILAKLKKKPVTNGHIMPNFQTRDAKISLGLRFATLKQSMECRQRNLKNLGVRQKEIRRGGGATTSLQSKSSFSFSHRTSLFFSALCPILKNSGRAYRYVRYIPHAVLVWAPTCRRTFMAPN